MTRVNVVDPTLLLDQHLMAEYREMPMVPAALRRSIQKFSKTPVDVQQLNIPSHYRLGSGHIKFFYDKPDYLAERFDKLVEELKLRGYNVAPNQRALHWEVFKSTTNFVRYVPSNQDQQLNIQRLLERFNNKPHLYTYYKQPMERYINQYTKMLNQN